MALLTKKQILTININRSAIPGKLYFSEELDPVNRSVVKLTYQGLLNRTLSLYQPAVTSSFKPTATNKETTVQKAIENIGNVVNTGSSGLTVGVYVAFAGGGQGSATVLNDYANFVVISATVGDSVKMPAISLVPIKKVYNNGVNDMELFPWFTKEFKVFNTLWGINNPISIGSGNSREFALISGVWQTG